MPGESRRRAKWADLTEFLATRPQSEDSVTLSWAELDRIVGGVPDSAVRHHPQWWHGDRSHVRAWRAAGYSAARIEPGRSVTFRRAGDAGPAVSAAGSRTEKPVAVTASSKDADALVALQEVDPHDTLLLIPCSKSKRTGGSRPVTEPARWPSMLVTARERNREAARIDERLTMPAWLRYSGHFYAGAEGALRDVVSEGAPLLILSGGYGVLQAQEPIGDYDKMMRLVDWPAGLLEGILIGQARELNVSSVVAFAAASSDYARLVRRTPWRGTGVNAFLVTIHGVSGGASGEVPRRLGRAFTCLWRQRPAEEYPKGTTVERLA